MLVFLHATHFTQVLRLELELGGRTQNSHYAKIYQQVLSGGVKRRNQNQKFSFPFFAGSPHTSSRKRNCKEKFWVLVHATGGSVRGAHCSLHHAIRAYDSVSSHHALGACEVRGFVGNGFGLFDTMTTQSHRFLIFIVCF